MSEPFPGLPRTPEPTGPFDSAAFASDLARLRERHGRELLETLRRHHGRQCPDAGILVEVDVWSITGEALPTVSACIHVLTAMGPSTPTGDYCVRVVDHWGANLRTTR